MRKVHICVRYFRNFQLYHGVNKIHFNEMMMVASY